VYLNLGHERFIQPREARQFLLFDHQTICMKAGRRFTIDGC
jgi:hypothetical protein